MSVGSQAKHLAKAGTFAQRTGMASRETVQATNQMLKNFKPQAMPAAARSIPPPPTVARKVTPTHVMDQMDLPKHLAKTNPAQAIQAGRQYGAKVVGNASVLDQLSRTGFDKLSMTTTSFDELHSKAQRGDILIMSPKVPPGGENAVSKIFNRVSRGIQGDLTHAAIYAGDGNVIDFRLDYGIKKMPFKDLAHDLDVAIVRPNVKEHAKDRAIAKIEKAMAGQKARYSVPQLFKTLAARVAPLGSDSKRLGDEICSTLISKSFDRKLIKGKVRSAVVPSDFLAPDSKATTFIARLNNPNRVDDR